MSKLTSLFIVGSSILAGGLMAAPAYANLQGTLQRGQTQSVEVSLDPGKYLLYIVAVNTITKDIPEASLAIYEPNGKFIRKSALLPPALQTPQTKQGTAIEVTRPQTVRFEIRMDSCPSPLCGFAVIPMKVSSTGLDPVTLRSRPPSTRPSSTASSPNTPKSSGVQPPQTPRATADTSQSSSGNQYVFNTNSHVSTEISVKPGDKIKVVASGRVRFGMFAGAGGPMGIIFNPEYNYFIDVPHGQLMGRVRQFGMQDLAGWVPIGEGKEFVVKTPGILEFAVNDNRPGDNVGRFRIEVTVNAAK
jgi:hypothetical protein